MEYSQGKIGRVFVVTLKEGEEVYPCLEDLAKKEHIRSALVLCMGGIRWGKLVTGPKDPEGKLEPIYQEFHDAREVFGIGTLFRDEDQPRLHLHVGVGRGNETLVGCARGGASVYLIQEITVLELVGIDARRVDDPETGLKLLRLLGANLRAVEPQALACRTAATPSWRYSRARCR